MTGWGDDEWQVHLNEREARRLAERETDDKRRAARYAKATGADKSSDERFAGMTRRPVSRRAELVDLVHHARGANLFLRDLAFLVVVVAAGYVLAFVVLAR